MSSNGPESAREQAEEILRRLEENPDYDVPAWMDLSEIESVIDASKPLSVNMSEVADELL